MREPRHAPLKNTGSPRGASAPRPSVLRIVGSALRGVAEGVLPIIILVCIVALFWEALTIARYVSIPYGFAVTRESETIISLGGLGISLIVFLVAGLRTLRGVRDQQYDGDYVGSTLAMIVLAITLVILFGVIWTTLGMPQHPAP